MSSVMADWKAKVVRLHLEAVARGEHDDDCEFHPDGFFLCHCGKRARLAKGHDKPPGELIYNYPTCPRCYLEVDHDGDGFVCERCHVVWSATDQGDEGEFTDDYGDVAGDRAKWLAKREEQLREAGAGGGDG